jgi:polar amino acid transport system substrate-binding protein
MMKKICFVISAALGLTCGGAFAADDCTKIIATGDPAYPVIAFKEGDAIAGAAPDLVAAIAKKLSVPLESKYTGSWKEAQEVMRDGEADLIFGIYYNDTRAGYLDYVQPAFMYDDVAVFVAKGKEFSFEGKDDLIGKKGVTTEGDSYGNELDAFMEEKLDVERTKGIGEGFKRLLEGKADYLLTGYHPGLAEAAAKGLKDNIVALDQALLTQEMFLAFSKKSPCRSLASDFGQGISELTTDGSFDKMLNEAQAEWDAQTKE